MLMKRILRVMTAALVMATMMVAMVMPAFAAPKDCAKGVYNCVSAGGDSDLSYQAHYLVNHQTGTYLYQSVYNDHGTGDKNAYTCKVAIGSGGSGDETCHGSFQNPR